MLLSVEFCLTPKTYLKGAPFYNACNAALEAKDPDELLKIVQDLNRALKREEQVRRAFREARRANNPSEEIQC